MLSWLVVVVSSWMNVVLVASVLLLVRNSNYLIEILISESLSMSDT